MGAHAERVERTEDFGPALERAIASNRAALIELVTDGEQISTRMTITQLRQKARASA
jgi:acetolactate synthase-1/2/3 large subunit